MEKQTDDLRRARMDWTPADRDRLIQQALLLNDNAAQRLLQVLFQIDRAVERAAVWGNPKRSTKLRIIQAVLCDALSSNMEQQLAERLCP